MKWNVYPIIHSVPHARSSRFDVLIFNSIVEELERRQHEVDVNIITGGPVPSSFVFHGETFTGLVNDAIILEHKNTGKFWVIDYQDCSAGPAFMLSPSDDFAGAWLTMFNRQEIKKSFNSIGSKYELIAPGWFSCIDAAAVEEARDQVEEIRNKQKLDPRLLFAGTIDGATPGAVYRTLEGGVRDVALVLRDKYPDEVRIVANKFPINQWLLEAASHQVCLALPGHPWCYRELELFNLGIPVLAYRWVSELQHRWIPNFHYTAVEEIGERHDMGWPLDTELGADRIIARYREVVNNTDLLDARARQAKFHYHRYFTAQKIGEEIVEFVLLGAMDE